MCKAFKRCLIKKYYNDLLDNGGFEEYLKLRKESNN